MAKYIKKPVIIDAENCGRLLYNASNAWKLLPEWIVKAYDDGKILFENDKIIIRTLEGIMEGYSSDMIIRGVNGEIYPCKPDIFAKTYEYAEEYPQKTKGE